MREVDEAVRQEQVGTAAKKYGLVIGGVLLLALLLFGAYLFWQNRQESRLEQRSEELVGAIDELEAGNERIADAELEALLADASPGGAAAARLLRAGIAVQQNRAGEAVALFDQVAADEDAPGPYRDFAAIRAVLVGYDNLQPQQVIERLSPLAVPGNAWYGSAGELVALAYLEQGQEDRAGPLLAAIARSDQVPETLRARTRQLAGLLGYDAVEDVDETLAAAAGDGTAQSVPALAPAPAQ
jgi:hypothetical protein